MVHRKAAVKPILLTYPHIKGIDAIITTIKSEKDPEVFFEFKDENTVHSFWRIKKKKWIQNLQDLFSRQVPKTFIADGHHRCSSTAYFHEKGAKNNPYTHILGVMIPDNQMRVHAFHRLVQCLNEITPSQLIARISNLAHIRMLQDPMLPMRRHEITMGFQNEWYCLQWKQEVLDQYRNPTGVLDTTLLNELILIDILGVQDIRQDSRVQYLEGPKGIRGIKKRLNRDPELIAFLLHPLTIGDMLNKASNNQMLPPKSTFFQPRMKNGLIVLEYE